MPGVCTVLASLASAGLVVALIGIYGVMSLNVATRTNEFGVRLALGAQPSNLLLLVIGQGLRLVFAGMVVGLAGAFALTRLMTTLLFGVTPTDATTIFAVSFSLLVVALLACYLAGRRATKVDPLMALRYE